MDLRRWVAVVLVVVMIAANVACVCLGLTTWGIVVGALLLVVLEVVKLLLIMKRFAASDGKSNGMLTLLIEGVTFFLAAIILVMIAVPYDDTKRLMLVGYCVDFFVVRGCGSLALSKYFWK